MTIETMKMWQDGKAMYRAWQQMVRVNGGVFPTEKDISQLARLLDLTPRYVSKRIAIFLEN